MVLPGTPTAATTQGNHVDLFGLRPAEGAYGAGPDPINVFAKTVPASTTSTSPKPTVQVKKEETCKKGDIYYDADGNYLKTVASETTNVYLSTPIANAAGQQITINTLLGTQAMFNAYTAAVYGESSGNAQESRGIADVIKNRSEYTGLSIFNIIVETGIYGYNKNSQAITCSGTQQNTNVNLVTARGSVIAALLRTSDTTAGAFFWEVLKYITPGSLSFNPNNWFVKQGWGSTPGTSSKVINFPSTTTIGATVFMKNNPQYRKVSYP